MSASAHVPRRLWSILFAILAFSLPALAQTPRVYLKFDGTLTDSSTAGIVTSVTTNGAAVSFNTDRFGVASRALDLSGSKSIQLIASSLPGNSNQALGLRNAAGSNTSFTLSAWIFCTNVSGGYNTVFGNLGSGTGTLHAGLGSNTARTHFGFDNNDANGATSDVAGSVWFHLAFVYDADAQTQRIWINGIPEVTRTAVTNTLKAADLLIGNWGGTGTDGSNDFRGRIDDVAVFNVALSGDQIYALASSVDPNALPAAGTYSAPKLPGFLGTTAKWGVRELRNVSSPNSGTTINGIGTGTLVNAERIARSNPTAAQAQIVDYQPSVLNIRDPSNGASHSYANDADWTNSSNNGTDDNYLVAIAKCAVRITAEDDYTFSFRGDDGGRLRVLGTQFLSSTKLSATVHAAEPAHSGDALHFLVGTGDSHTLGVVHLVPGDYNIEYLHWEGAGGSSIEISAARGAKTANDGTFRLIGDTAGGGLEIVRDPDTLPKVFTFTGNSVTPLFLHSPLPPNFTMAWTTNSADLPGLTVSINQGIGSVAQNGSTSVATPATTTTYTLTAQNGADITNKALTVHINAQPVIHSFTSNKTVSIAGQPVTLSWSVDGAQTLTLQPGNINVTGQSSIVVNPTTDTTYTLQATNPAGTTQQNVSLTIGPGPVINSFTVSDANPLFGAEVALSWNVTPAGATTISIDQGVGNVSPVGTAAVLVLKTTTYTLTASNAFGALTASVTVNQPTPIGVTSAGFTAHRVSSTVAFPFAGQGYLQSAISLLGGQNLASQTTQGGYATINFADGADGDFTTGNVGFPGGGGDNFAMRVTGTLVVNTAGEYTFVVNCDDGARLSLDLNGDGDFADPGEVIIIDDGSHGPSASSGRVSISRPTVALELIYYDTTGGAELELGWIRPNLEFSLLSTITPAAPIVRGQVLISEFMADNTELLDELGASADWIEIWNSTAATVNLSGYFLTDDSLIPNKWPFPAWTLGPNQYLIVFASSRTDPQPAQAVPGQDNPGTVAQPRLHTNFSISKNAGRYLALMQTDGGTGFIPITVFSNYPEQKEDISYGSSDAEGFIGYMETATPLQPNAVSHVGFVADTVFSVKRGRYSAPFSLAITSATTDAIIRYTTDGSPPTRTHGTIYSGPISISSTRSVRAFAYKAGWKETNVDSHSYLFVDDIVNQSNATATALGWPTSPINGQVFEWPMSVANVTSAGGTLQDLKNALAAAPSVCMTTDVFNMIDPATGNYVNPARRGLFSERPCSIEYINAAGTSEFQIDCGYRIRGGASRAVTNPRHAFHLYFRGSLYDGDLKYRLFGLKGASRFDQIDMRCEQNYSWSKDNSTANTHLREEFGRVTQLDMAQPHSRTSYFHLYVNGLYWGIFNWEERTEADFGVTYLGGVKENFDTVKSAGSPGGYNTEMTDGNFIAWNALNALAASIRLDTASEASRTAKYMQARGLNPDGTPNASFPVYLDVDNLIDYMLTTFYCGSYDAPMSTFLSNASNNWFGVRERGGSRGFTFYVHDFEHGMDAPGQSGASYNRVGPWGLSGTNNWNQVQYNSRDSGTTPFFNTAKSNPHYLHELLSYSLEYRVRFADRAQKHFFNGGALTTTKALERLNALAAQVDPIIHAEAARWGSTSLNKNAWLSAKNVVTNFINNAGVVPSGHPALIPGDRTSIIVQILRGYQEPVGTAKALFPPTTLSAPVFSGNFGGPVPQPHNFNISLPGGTTGTIYYTVNGVDPRAIGGSIAPGVLTGASPIPVTLNNSATVRARVFDGTNWSALTEAQYLVGGLATSSNLVISKIHYNPKTDQPPAPADPNDLTEFIELLNIGANTIDLTNVQFSIGLQFQFPDNFTLASGGRALIVRDVDAFTTRYQSVPVAMIAGAFANDTALENSGERLVLLDALGATLRDFSYDDDGAWPRLPDGDGPSLVLKRPETNPNHALPANWRASSGVDGSPGVNEGPTYAAWAALNNVTDLIGTGDDDGDGFTNLAEYLLGGNPKVPSLGAVPSLAVQSIDVGGVVSDYLTLTFKRAIGRDEASVAGQAATDVGSWSAAVQVGDPIYNTDGTETLTFRHPQPKTSLTTQQFLRLQITRQP